MNITNIVKAEGVWYLMEIRIYANKCRRNSKNSGKHKIYFHVLIALEDNW